MGILDRLRKWRDGPHADVDVERQSAEVCGRVEQATDRLAKAIEQLTRQIDETEDDE